MLSGELNILGSLRPRVFANVLGYRSTLSVNTVDTLYAAFPMFMYLNPELGGYALSPLLEYQDSAAYTLSYAAKNIGTITPP